MKEKSGESAKYYSSLTKGDEQYFVCIEAISDDDMFDILSYGWVIDNDVNQVNIEVEAIIELEIFLRVMRINIEQALLDENIGNSSTVSYTVLPEVSPEEVTIGLFGDCSNGDLSKIN